MTIDDLWAEYDLALKEASEVKADNPHGLARARARLVALANRLEEQRRNYFD